MIGAVVGNCDLHVYTSTEAGWATVRLRAVYGPNSDSPADFRYALDTNGNLDLSGSWIITLDVEEWVDYLPCLSNDDQTYPTDSEWGFPTYGGPVTADMPTGVHVRFYERPHIGGRALARLECLDGVAECDEEITAGNQAGYFELMYAMVLKAGLTTLLYSDIAHMEGSFLGAAVTEKYYREHDSGYGYVQRATVDGSAVTLDVTGTVNGACWVRAIIGCPSSFNLEGRVRSDASSFAQTLPVRVLRKQGEAYHQIDAVGGAFGDAYTQRGWSCTSTLDDASQTEARLTENAPVRCWLVSQASEASLWRCLLRGRAFDAFTLGHAASQVLDGGFAVTTTPTARNITATRCEGYRYLEVSTDFDAGEQLTLDIDAKQFTAVTDSGGVATFDLCLPTNLGGAVEHDQRDTRLPMPTDVDTVTGDGCMWGVAIMSGYTITASASGNVATDGVALIRRPVADGGHTTVDFLPTLGQWYSDGGTREYRPFLRGDTDGRRSLEEMDCYREPVGGTYTQLKLENLVSEIGGSDLGVVRNPAWTATISSAINQSTVDGGDLLNDWLNRDRPATWAWGAGALWAVLSGETAHRWHYLDQDARNALTVVAQELADEVVFYPGIGDAFFHRDGARCGEIDEDGTHPDRWPIELRAAAYLRGVAWGLAADAAANPLEGARVRVHDAATKALAGQGITDHYGEYITGPPGGVGGVSYEVTLPPIVTETFDARKRHRVCFIGGCDCCRDRTLIATPAYFPFVAQTGDAWIRPLEQWRPIPPVGASEDGEARRLSRQSPRAAEIRAYVEHLRRAPV